MNAVLSTENDGRPIVMGILNATPDSFFEASRCPSADLMAARAKQIVAEGAAIIDVGACSTRPGSTPISEEEELARLDVALSIVTDVCPTAVVSVDTFRPRVVRWSREKYGVSIINDVTGGCPEMFEAVAGATYILTSNLGIDQTMETFAQSLDKLHRCGCHDVWLDPGYGFGKTMDQNYEMLRRQDELLAFGLPILAGLSRKRMVWQLLGTSPAEALTGTVVLNTLALMHGARILRVHDVREAVETIKIMGACS